LKSRFTINNSDRIRDHVAEESERLSNRHGSKNANSGICFEVWLPSWKVAQNNNHVKTCWAWFV